MLQPYTLDGKWKTWKYPFDMMLKYVRMDQQDALGKLRDQAVEEVWFKGHPAWPIPGTRGQEHLVQPRRRSGTSWQVHLTR